MWTINQFPRQSIGSNNLTVDSLLTGRDSSERSRPTDVIFTIIRASHTSKVYIPPKSKRIPYRLNGIFPVHYCISYFISENICVPGPTGIFSLILSDQPVNRQDHRPDKLQYEQDCMCTPTL